MKRKLFGIAGALVVLLALIVLEGCATARTTQVTFAAAEPLQGELKCVVIDAISRGGDSVLQRFYARYPHEKYQVVSCELLSKNWMPVVGAIGGAVLGAAIGVPIAVSNYPEETYNYSTGWTTKGSLGATIVGFSLPAITTVVGALLGNRYKDKYIVTYIEKAGAGAFSE